jgi:hypothetical protein
MTLFHSQFRSTFKKKKRGLVCRFSDNILAFASSIHNKLRSQLKSKCGNLLATYFFRTCKVSIKTLCCVFMILFVVVRHCRSEERVFERGFKCRVKFLVLFCDINFLVPCDICDTDPGTRSSFNFQFPSKNNPAKTGPKTAALSINLNLDGAPIVSKLYKSSSGRFASVMGEYVISKLKVFHQY